MSSLGFLLQSLFLLDFWHSLYNWDWQELPWGANVSRDCQRGHLPYLFIACENWCEKMQKKTNEHSIHALIETNQPCLRKASTFRSFHVTQRFHVTLHVQSFLGLPFFLSQELHENARHTSSNGFTGVRGDRRVRWGTGVSQQWNKFAHKSSQSFAMLYIIMYIYMCTYLYTYICIYIYWIYKWIFNYIHVSVFMCIPLEISIKAAANNCEQWVYFTPGVGWRQPALLVFLCFFVLPLMGCIPLRGTVPAHVWFASWVPRQHIIIDAVRLKQIHFSRDSP